jgi:hypothetical protein
LSQNLEHFGVGNKSYLNNCSALKDNGSCSALHDDNNESPWHPICGGVEGGFSSTLLNHDRRTHHVERGFWTKGGISVPTAKPANHVVYLCKT